MNSLVRWKLISGGLAVACAFLLYRGWGDGDVPAPSVDAKEVPRDATTALRQLRIPAAALGLEESAVIRQLRSTRNARTAVMLCEKLGFIGGGNSVDALAELVGDPRPGVEGAAVRAIGHIGSAKAMRLLLSLEQTGKRQQRAVAITALGMTGSADAKARLLEIASSRDDLDRASAISALGEMGGDDVVDLFASLLGDGDRHIRRTVVYALARIGGDKAEQLLVELSSSSDPQTRALALRLVPSADDTHVAHLMEVLASGDPQSAAAAATALARTKSATAINLLVEMAETGASQVRSSAIYSLGTIGGDKARKALARTLRGTDRNAKHAAAQALLSIGDAESRDILIAGAREASGDRSFYLGALRQLRGPEVDAIMVDIASNGRQYERRTALEHLITVGDDRAVDLAIEMATKGSRNERGQAVALLADANTERGWEALTEIATSSRGYARIQAIEMLGRVRPDDPALRSMLIDSMKAGNANEKRQAVSLLARSGDREARAAVLDALNGSDEATAQAALGVVMQLDGTDDVQDALVKLATESNSQTLKQSALNQLLSSGSSQGIDLARKVLESGDASAASGIVWSLNNSSNADATKLLASASHHESAEVRAAAAHALGQKQGKSLSEDFTSLLDDGDQNVRSAAIQSLGNLGTGQAVDKLLAVASDQSSDDRRNAISALSRVEDTRAINAMAGFIGDSDDQISISAIQSSHNLGREAETAMLSLLASDRSENVRRAAASELRRRGGKLDAAQQELIESLLGPRS